MVSIINTKKIIRNYISVYAANKIASTPTGFVLLAKCLSKCGKFLCYKGFDGCIIFTKNVVHLIVNIPYCFLGQKVQYIFVDAC